MSKVAKATFAVSLALTSLTVYGVHLQQRTERDNMYQGVLRDEERLAAKRKEKAERQAEFEEQNRRRAYLEKVQPVSNPSAPKNDAPSNTSSSSNEEIRFEGCKTC